jgi:uncharacterized protein
MDARLGPSLRVLLASLLLLVATLAVGAPAYPELTGRVVDQAGIIPEATRADLTRKLKELEEKSSIQLAIATVPSLDGTDVESYANGLFRFWKLGEAKKNNGVLFLVAPNERKTRIEVGYGLEGTLTDALSKVILATAVTPKFKAGDYGAGIERGVDGIIEVLSGDTAEWVKKPAPLHSLPVDDIFLLMIFAIFIFNLVMMARSAGRPGRYRRYQRGGSPIIILPPGGGWSDGCGGSSGGSWDSGGSDSFSGGGGSSGGGGASGDW